MTEQAKQVITLLVDNEVSNFHIRSKDDQGGKYLYWNDGGKRINIPDPQHLDEDLSSLEQSRYIRRDFSKKAFWTLQRSASKFSSTPKED